MSENSAITARTDEMFDALIKAGYKTPMRFESSLDSYGPTLVWENPGERVIIHVEGNGAFLIQENETVAFLEFKTIEDVLEMMMAWPHLKKD